MAMDAPLTERMAKESARIVFALFTNNVRLNDHIRQEVAVVCGEHSSGNNALN
jgi:hypothetical protein